MMQTAQLPAPYPLTWPPGRMSSNQPSLDPTVIRVVLVTTSGTTPPPNGPEFT
jgi:hypothetical protein